MIKLFLLRHGDDELQGEIQNRARESNLTEQGIKDVESTMGKIIPKIENPKNIVISSGESKRHRETKNIIFSHIFRKFPEADIRVFAGIELGEASDEIWPYTEEEYISQKNYMDKSSHLLHQSPGDKSVYKINNMLFILMDKSIHRRTYDPTHMFIIVSGRTGQVIREILEGRRWDEMSTFGEMKKKYSDFARGSAWEMDVENGKIVGEVNLILPYSKIINPEGSIAPHKPNTETLFKKDLQKDN